MLEEPVRNHPTVIIQNIAASIFVILVVVASMSGGLILIEAFMYIALGILGIILLVTVYFVVWWSRTTLCANESELIEEYAFISKKKKTVPYAKIASVNVVRAFWNRIFGTATLNININSAANADRPEIAFVFKLDVANQVRDELSAHIYGSNYSAKNEEIYESVINVTNKDSVLHGMFGTSTVLTLLSTGSLVYTAASVFISGEFNALSVTMLITAVGFFVPVVQLILRYYNFKVYRIGDTIYLNHGAIQQYRTSFNVNRINAVRIKRTLAARLMNKACLEVEVVGLNATQDTVPVLCILTSMENIDRLMREVVPNFIYENEGARQPKSAYSVWMIKALLKIVPTSLLMIPLIVRLLVFNTDLDGSMEAIIDLGIGCLTVYVALVVFYIVFAHTAYKIYRFDMGENTFMFVTGVVDRSKVIMQYDRVQIASTSAWPRARRLGLARCNISLLSSIGHMEIVSGYFDVDELSKIQKEVLDRIRDGRYDYKKMTF